MTGRLATLLLVFLVCISLVLLLGPACSPPDLATMVERVRPGVVRIDTWEGAGSGVIFDTTSEGGALVLTNYHVIDGPGRVTVEVEDSATYRGHRQGYDADMDLAVVSICCGKFKKLSFGDVSKLKPGSEVVAIGYPLDLPGAASITRGIVSAIRSKGDFEIIQMDAPINPGNSGGPLLSASGEVLGINTFTIGSEGLGFALSERTVQMALPEIKGDRLIAVAAAARLTPTPGRDATPTHVPAPTANPGPTPTPRPTATPRPTSTPQPTATPRPTPTPRPTATPSPTSTPTPTPVKLTAISSGPEHTCGLRLDGTPVCWGGDDFGEASPPVGEKFTSISSGEYYTCALRSDGSPACWGLDANSQASPPPNGRFVTISSGYRHTCALRSDGTPVCWGLNGHGQASPPAGEKLTSIDCGISQTCGLRLDGTPVCWGISNGGAFWLSPPPGERFTSITSSYSHTCGLRLNGTPVCWGLYGDHQASSSPRERLTGISSGPFHACGIRKRESSDFSHLDGTLACWGDLNSDMVPSGKFAYVSSGFRHTCGLRPDGTPVCWGSNSHGQTDVPMVVWNDAP